MHPYEVGAAIPSYYRSRFGCRPHAPARKTLSRPQLLRAAERLRETPIKIAYILLGIALTQYIDEPFIGLAWLVGELDLVLLIKLCNPLANCRLALNAQTLR